MKSEGVPGSLALVLMMAGAVAACASRDPRPPVDASAAVSRDALAGTSWRFVELNGAPVQADAERRAPQLAFGGDGHVYASDGCNRLLGSYQLNDDRLTFSQMAATQMACQGSEDGARRLHEAIGEETRWQINGQLLTLHGRKGQTLAILERLTVRE